MSNPLSLFNLRKRFYLNNFERRVKKMSSSEKIEYPFDKFFEKNDLDNYSEKIGLFSDLTKRKKAVLEHGLCQNYIAVIDSLERDIDSIKRRIDYFEKCLKKGNYGWEKTEDGSWENDRINKVLESESEDRKKHILNDDEKMRKLGFEKDSKGVWVETEDRKRQQKMQDEILNQKILKDIGDWDKRSNYPKG